MRLCGTKFIRWLLESHSCWWRDWPFTLTPGCKVSRRLQWLLKITITIQIPVGYFFGFHRLFCLFWQTSSYGQLEMPGQCGRLFFISRFLCWFAHCGSTNRFLITSSKTGLQTRHFSWELLRVYCFVSWRVWFLHQFIVNECAIKCLTAVAKKANSAEIDLNKSNNFLIVHRQRLWSFIKIQALCLVSELRIWTRDPRTPANAYQTAYGP